MGHRSSTLEGVNRLTGDLPAWKPEVQDTSSHSKNRAPYGILTAFALFLGLAANVVALWHPTFRNGDGQFVLSYFVYGNLGTFVAYLTILAAAAWLCLRDTERARPQKLVASVCTLVVLAICVLPIAQYFHVFEAPLEHPQTSSDAA